MKGCKIKKKDRRHPVFVLEIKKTHDKCVPPKMLIKDVHPTPHAKHAVIRFDEPLPVQPV